MNYYTDVLKKYAVFNGRATRKEYWMFVLWSTIIYVVCSGPLSLDSYSTSFLVFFHSLTPLSSPQIQTVAS